MYRGTSPVLIIETDTDLRLAQYVVVTLEDFSGNEINADTTSGALEISETEVKAKLTQEQTLRLTKGTVRMQIRAVDASGNAIASNIMSTKMEDVLKDGVIP